MPQPGRVAGPLIVAALVLASLAALVITQRSRRSGLVLDSVSVSPSFSPDGDGVDDQAEFEFRIKGPDDIDLLIVNSEGKRIREVADGQTLEDQEITTFEWDGLTDRRVLAPPGPYRIRVKVLGRDRTITPGEKIVLLAPGELPPEETEG